MLSWLVVLSVLLSLCVCSVSAVDDKSFIPYFPLSDDFIRPADSNSIVYDVHYNNDIVDRIVFPADANVLAGMNDSGGMSFIWACPNFSEEDVLFRYRLYVGSSEFTFLDKIAPTKIGDSYLGTFYTVNSVVSYVTNNQIFSGDDFIVEQNGVSVAFPNSQLQEEKKTQGMISQLIQDIKDWFSNLIESMGNFFSNLADKIKSFFTQLVEDIKGLFVPSDGFFNEYSDKFEVWAREHFGFLFETIEIIDTILTKLINFSPSDSALITLPKTSFSIHGKEYVLWNSITYNFNSLLNEVPALNTLHSIYFTVVYALFFYLLYRLGEKSYNDIFGGRD